ncbi:MAG: FtsX-like permease family protein [Desulfobulbaceae bacterium]|nr:FtsX-like permease family protein [Desulfobulbaceae bacterium]
MHPLSLSTKNLTRKGFRSAALVFALALVVCLLFAGAIAVKSVSTSITLGAQRLGADLMIVPEGYEDTARTTLIAGKPSVFYMPESVLDRVRKVKGVRRATPQLFIQSTDFECCTYVDVLLIAFDQQTDFTIGSWLKEAIDRPLADNETIIGRSIPVSTGTTMKYFGTPLTVVGDLATTGLEYIDHAAFMTMATARQMIRNSRVDAEQTLDIGEDMISTVLVQLDPAITPERAKVFVEYEIEGVKALTSQDVIGSVKRQLQVLIRTIGGIGLSLWLITILLIGIVFSMAVNERKREIGLLRAMGAKRKNIFGMITIEAVLLSLAGGVLGLVAGGFLLIVCREPMRNAFKLPSLWPEPMFIFLAALFAVGAALVSGVVAAAWPAYKSSRMEPYQAIRKGE